MREGTQNFQGSPIMALLWAQAKNNLPSPELWAPCVWIEPSPGLLRRITRNRPFPPSVPHSRSPHTNSHIGCFSGSLRAGVASVSLTYPPQCAPGELCQASQPPVCVAPAQGSAGPRAVSSGCWWQRHSELLQSPRPPPPGTAAVAAARSLASLPASISSAWSCLLQPP